MTSDDMTFLSVFLMGMMGAPHCAGMCGGIVGALAMRSTRAGSGPGSILLSNFSYNFGRITTYTLLGLIFGGFGTALQHFIPLASVLLRTLAGLLMICMGLYIGGWWLGLRHLENLGYKLWKPIPKLGLKGRKRSSLLEGYLAGVLWGWLPCGLVYTVLTVALTTGDTLQGGLIMICFGLGTLPALVLAGTLTGKLTSFTSNKMTTSIMGLVVILFGIWALKGVTGVKIHVRGNGQMQRNEQQASAKELEKVFWRIGDETYCRPNVQSC